MEHSIGAVQLIKSWSCGKGIRVSSQRTDRSQRMTVPRERGRYKEAMRERERDSVATSATSAVAVSFCLPRAILVAIGI